MTRPGTRRIAKKAAPARQRAAGRYTGDTLPRPQRLTLDLRTHLTSWVTEDQEHGVQPWFGTIRAHWYTDDDGRPPHALTAPDRPWSAAVDHGEAIVEVGTMTLWKTHANGDHPALADATPIDTPGDVLDALDIISQDLTDAFAPLVRDDGTRFIGGVEDLAEYGVTDVVILDRVELAPHARHHGIGAWACARALAVLADSPSTLIAAQAAPTNHEDFYATPLAPDDPDREFTPAERRVWKSAQSRLAEHWAIALDLEQLPDRHEILFGVGGPTDARYRTLAGWN